MASEILIRFRTATLDKAREAAQSIKKTINEAIRSIKDPELRKGLRQAVREEQRVDTAERSREARRLKGLREDGAEINPPESRPSLEAAKSLTRLGLKVDALSAGSASGRTLESLAAMLAPQLAGSVFLLTKIKEIVDEEIAADNKNVSDQIDAAIAKAQFETDFDRRMNEDPDFAQRVATATLDAVKDLEGKGLLNTRDFDPAAPDWLRSGALQGF